MDIQANEMLWAKFPLRAGMRKVISGARGSGPRIFDTALKTR
jgi:hypothetical protein